MTQAGLLWDSADDDYRCAFRVDSSGSISHLFTDGTTAFERRRLVAHRRAQRAVFSFVLRRFRAGWSVRRQWLLNSCAAPGGAHCLTRFAAFAGLGLRFAGDYPDFEREMGFATASRAGDGSGAGAAAHRADRRGLVPGAAGRDTRMKDARGVDRRGRLFFLCRWLAEWNLLGWRY
ncbi:MAG: hypothetical protein HS123_15875 [Solibacteraceae bacterium]|nr:hypothetical protein [Solibacteraceae bacterium]